MPNILSCTNLAKDFALKKKKKDSALTKIGYLRAKVKCLKRKYQYSSKIFI